MKNKGLNSTRILAVGFVFIILYGAAMLHLPIASRDGNSLPLLNAIFTSTSATCVTGLILYDTWTQFSLFGQVIILLLIQVGGLGFMTAVIAVLTLTHRRIGLKQRTVLGDSVGISQLSGIVRLARRILVGTAIFEIIGAVVLATRFVPMLGYANGIWCAVFHSISAFCNAGFDIMGQIAPGSSLTTVAGDPVVLMTIAALIIAGGIGFIVWNDIIDSLKEKRKLNLHTTMTLLATAVLLVVGMLLMLVTEWNGVLREMSIGERLLNAFFHSVTPRTAGFNSVDIASMTDGGKLVTILLMVVGAAPGGTGGGIKITTFVVVLLTVVSSLRGSKETSISRFRLEPDIVRRAFSASTLYCGMALLGVFIMCLQSISLSDALFECFSAIGTVGLSTGITSELGELSKVVLILLMYAGRVGSFTVFLAVAGENRASKLKNPVGKIIVG